MKNKIAYITSGVAGIHRFTYNELTLLKERGVEFNLCLTQLNKGPCMPKKDWIYYTAGRIKSITQFINLTFSKTKVLELFFEAKKNRVLSYFFIALSFYKDIKNSNITSLHCQMGDDKLYIGYFLKKLLRIPLTVTVHAHELYSRKVYDDNDEIKKLFASCDKVITISDFNSNIINKSLGVDKDKLEVMRLFPDIDELNFVKDKIKILIVANWWEKKGYNVLFKALKKLKRNDFTLWVVGGSYFSENSVDVEKLVQDYEMENEVAIFGQLGSPLLDILYYACDIFCLPSYTEYYSDGKPAEREGIPVALMEAMAWGKPVIATKHAGNSELVEEFLVEERNVDELAESIQYLFDNKDKWKELGKRNKEIITEKFSKSNIESLVNVIDGLKKNKV